MRTAISGVTCGLLLMLLSQATQAQQDSVDNSGAITSDSLPPQSGTAGEILVEQTPEVEDDPLLDLLAADLTGERSVEVRSRLTQRVQSPIGYRNGAYIGSALKSYQRIKFRQGSLSGGILSTKDPGEPHLNEFITANLVYRSGSTLSEIVIGDYRIEAGQGIAFWRGHDITKGGNVVAPVMREARGLRDALSADEASYFRGAVATLVAGPVSSTVFYSTRSLNAAVDSEGTATSLYNSGYFRTLSEQNKRNTFGEKIFGVHTLATFDGVGTVGVSAYRANFGRSLLLEGGKKFTGADVALAAVDYDLKFGQLSLFGEWGAANSAIGGISGILLRPANAMSIVGAIRHYALTFFSLHGLGFGERSGTSNETGVYFGLHLPLTRSIRASAYIDQYRFPAGTVTSGFPLDGEDMFVEFESASIRRVALTLRFQRMRNDRSDATATEQGQAEGGRHGGLLQRMRIQADFHLSERARFRCRIERVFVEPHSVSPEENGALFYGDIILQDGRVLSNVRLSYFHTDSYVSRISMAERDLDGVLTVPVLYGSGLRWYALVRYDLSTHVRLSARYSDLLRDDVRTIGSGLDRLETNHDNRVGIQMDLSL